MTTKQILKECYELVASKSCGKKRVHVYRATTMQDLPCGIVENYADPNQLCPDSPYKGLRLEETSRSCYEWDVQLVLGIHGSIVDMYVCAILVRPCSKEAQRHYESLKGKKASDRIGLMWDSRNFDKKKKRVRATLKQVRSLEAEVRDLKQALDISMGKCSDMLTLEASNKLMEEELARLRERLEEAEKGWEEGKEEVNRLMNRGFWARVFNK